MIAAVLHVRLLLELSDHGIEDVTNILLMVRVGGLHETVFQKIQDRQARHHVDFPPKVFKIQCMYVYPLLN